MFTEGRIADEKDCRWNAELFEKRPTKFEEALIAIVEGHSGQALPRRAIRNTVYQLREWDHVVRSRQPAHLSCERRERHMQAKTVARRWVVRWRDVVITEDESAARQPTRERRDP